MKKLKLIFVIIMLYLFFSSSSVFSQGVAINTTGNPADASAMLDVQSADKGFLVPRIATWAGNPASPTTGLLIYNLVGDGINGAGFYYYTGTSWVKMFGGGTNDYILNQSASNQSADFRISGNGYVNGYIGVGTVSPANAKLQVEGSGTYDAVFRLRNTDATGANAFLVASNSAWTFGSNKLGIGIGDPSSTNIKLTIQADGNVGFGITSPLGKLHTYIGTEAVTAATYAVYLQNLATNTTTDGISKYGGYFISQGSFTGSSGTATNNYGLYTVATGADNNYGVWASSATAIYGVGTVYGVYGNTSTNNAYGGYFANTSTGTGTQYALRAQASGATGTGTKYGVYSLVNGSATTNYAIYGNASGGDYQLGRVFYGKYLHIG